MNQFPIGIIGVRLLFAGIELAMASKDTNSKEGSFVDAGLCGGSVNRVQVLPVGFWV